MRALIFANGTMDRWPDGLDPVPAPTDLVIAADGGLRHCRRWNQTPHVLIGDMDSVDPVMMAAVDPGVTTIIRHPAQKDETDLELALKLAISRKSRDIVILGALGGRLDMTLSNVMLLGAAFLEGIAVGIYDGHDELRCLKGGGQMALSGSPGDRLSILPLSETVSGVTLDGLAYPLWRALLPLGTSHGISNVFTGDTARICIEKGTLLITVNRSPSGSDTAEKPDFSTAKALPA